MPRLSEEEREQLLEALYRVYSDFERARDLAVRAGFPRGDLPSRTSSRQFWDQVFVELEHGRVFGGVQALIDHAAREYQANEVFRRFSSVDEARAAEPRPGWSDDDGPALDPFPGGREARRLETHELPELVAVGQRVGEVVRWSYFRTGSGPPFVERKVRWDSALEKHRDALVSAEPSELQRLGVLLGQLLLGKHGEPDYHGIARSVMRSPEALSITPLAGPVRCRLVLDQELERLPWRLTAVEDVDGNPYWLTDIGWTFEHGAQRRSSQEVRLPNPCSIMFVVPQHGPQHTAGAELVRMAKEQLVRLWPTESNRLDGRVAVVHDMAAAVHELRHRTRPEVVVFFGRVTPGSEPCFELHSGTEEDGEVDDVPLARFCEELVASGVKLLVLASTRAVVVPPEVRRAVPCILAPTISSGARDTVFTLQAWLWAMLAEGLGPVRAMHRVPRSGATRRWCAMRAHADFNRWTVAPAVAARVDELARRRIDRDGPRALFIRHIEELVADERRRVDVFLAHGGVDDRLEWLGDQLQQECKDRKHEWKFQRRKVRFPALSGGPRALKRCLEQVVFGVLAVEDDEPLSAEVQRVAKRGGWPRSPFVYWLDWGVRPDGLDERGLAAWLQMTVRVLPQLTEGLAKVRVVTTLAVRPEDPDAFHDTATELAEDLQDHLTAITVFDPLGQVTPSHLMRYMRAPDITSCPESLVKPVARAIVRRTGGRFKAVIDMIERAERDNRWHELVETSPRQ